MQKAPSNDTQLEIINLMVGISHSIPQIAENQWALKVIHNVLKLSQYLQQICSNVIQTYAPLFYIYCTDTTHWKQLCFCDENKSHHTKLCLLCMGLNVAIFRK